jgi:hypothetical protein
MKGEEKKYRERESEEEVRLKSGLRRRRERRENAHEQII